MTVEIIMAIALLCGAQADNQKFDANVATNCQKRLIKCVEESKQLGGRALAECIKKEK